MSAGPGGETGIHKGLKIPRLRKLPCRFESGPGHQRGWWTATKDNDIPRRLGYTLQSAQTRDAAVKTLCCLMLAAMLAGCLPIGIRGTNLPNYGEAPSKPNSGTPAAARTA